MFDDLFWHKEIESMFSYIAGLFANYIFNYHWWYYLAWMFFQPAAGKIGQWIGWSFGVVGGYFVDQVIVKILVQVLSMMGIPVTIFATFFSSAIVKAVFALFTLANSYLPVLEALTCYACLYWFRVMASVWRMIVFWYHQIWGSN